MVLKPVQRHCFKTILQSQDVQTGDCKTESRGIWMQVRGRNIVKEKLKREKGIRNMVIFSQQYNYRNTG